MFGEMLRHLRGKRSLSAVARLANISKGHLHDLEHGRRMPSESVARRLDQLFHANGELIAAYESHATSSAKADVRPSIAQTDSAPNLDITAQSNDEEDATNRRRLLQLAASAGVLGYGESVRQMLDITVHAQRSVEDWVIAQSDHLYALRTRPPAQVIADLAVDLHELAQQIEIAASSDLPELYRTAALLSCIQANALTRLADHGTAIRWWRTARQTADASRDLDLRLLVHAEEAISGLYGQRSPETVLRLVHNAREITSKPWPRLVVAEAEALALLGRHDEAARALRALQALAHEGIAGDSAGFWIGSEIYFTQSWVSACAGNEAEADAARDHVLKVAPHHAYQYRTNVRLHEALCAVAEGGVERGVQMAAGLIDSLPSVRRTNHILETARMVMRAVPLDQQTRPAVNDLRALLAIGTS